MWPVQSYRKVLCAHTVTVNVKDGALCKSSLLSLFISHSSGI